MNPTHLIGHFSKGGTRTLCGLPLNEREIARNGQPTCDDCARIDDQDAASLLALQQTEHVPSAPVREFNPFSGYKPRRSAR